MVFQVFLIPTAPLVALTPSQNDKKIDNLTDMIRTLALLVCTLQGDIGTSSTVAQPGTQPPKLSSKSRIRTGYQKAGPIKNWSEDANKCIYCWSTDHSLKRHCQVFQDDLNSNRIHLGDKDRVCLGPYSLGRQG